MERVLVVDHDRVLQKALKRLFESEGYSVAVTGDGRSALEAFQTNRPAAIILDLSLPIIRGLDVCRAIRHQSLTVPIVVLSATTNLLDKVLLLEIGADDYVTKPFSPRGLLARVRAAIRRKSILQTHAKTRFGGVCVDFESMDVTLDDRPVSLTALEFKILTFLVQNAESAVSRQQLGDDVNDYPVQASSRTIDNHIFRLRQKLERNPAHPIHFLTVRRVGYKFVW